MSEILRFLATHILASTLFFSHAYGEDQHRHHEGHDHKGQQATSMKIGEGKILIKVKGMVCAFCAQGIEKNFNKREEVKSTKVDLDKMEVLIELKNGKTLSEDTIKKIVTDAGFSYAGIQN